MPKGCASPSKPMAKCSSKRMLFREPTFQRRIPRRSPMRRRASRDPHLTGACRRSLTTRPTSCGAGRGWDWTRRGARLPAGRSRRPDPRRGLKTERRRTSLQSSRQTVAEIVIARLALEANRHRHREPSRAWRSRSRSAPRGSWIATSAFGLLAMTVPAARRRSSRTKETHRLLSCPRMGRPAVIVIASPRGRGDPGERRAPCGSWIATSAFRPPRDNPVGCHARERGHPVRELTIL